MSFRLMYAAIAAAAALVVWNIGRYIVGPGNWNGR